MRKPFYYSLGKKVYLQSEGVTEIVATCKDKLTAKKIAQFMERDQFATFPSTCSRT